ncbi:MAG: UDP-glucose/GDP-mannose dehydrogenase family protein [Acidimicrobiaceae bacterium]|nr:UDP-glucose/GDP-mannose dehydrogenase family protein [Acidimicrobiaceae bacterium]
MPETRVAVIGAGYVGLTSAACLAHLGHRVICSDIDAERIAGLEHGEIPIFEDGLAELVREGLGSGQLRFTTSNVAAVEDADFVLLCVPTPSSDDGRADMSYISTVAAEIGRHLSSDAIVINKSTVPVGSTHAVERALGRTDVAVVSNPEFLREGSAVHDFLHPDRIVIGADDESTAIKVSAMFLRTSAPLVVTDPASAETIKYASNAFLATKLSFVNAVAALCEALGADVRHVVLGMGYDRRIGSDYLRPGPGWGGSCFPKDTAALIRIADDAGYDFGLLKGAVEVNEDQYLRMAEKAIRLAGGSVEHKVFALWGLTFKARTGDLRQSPALEIAGHLRAGGATIRAYDPTVHTPMDGMTVCNDAYAACEGADVLVVATEWDEFRWLDFAKVAEEMRGRALLDCRNLLDPAALRRHGFAYEGVGLT